MGEMGRGDYYFIIIFLLPFFLLFFLFFLFSFLFSLLLLAVAKLQAAGKRH